VFRSSRAVLTKPSQQGPGHGDSEHLLKISGLVLMRRARGQAECTARTWGEFHPICTICSSHTAHTARPGTWDTLNNVIKRLFGVRRGGDCTEVVPSGSGVTPIWQKVTKGHDTEEFTAYTKVISVSRLPFLPYTKVSYSAYHLCALVSHLCVCVCVC